MVVEAATFAALNEHEARVFRVGVVDPEADWENFRIQIEQLEVEGRRAEVVDVAEIDFEVDGFVIDFHEDREFFVSRDSIDVVVEVFDVEAV